ncbi:unnamed protein product [Brassica rapa]|uniref:Uncharacterized protein n=1 Tax=Brassica campestris TaxID=3711 RepID=A0A3P6CL62_BRACM|nr:unnamed protein product [Brassica rapa]VDD10771.1 unnamed protein product [Brassica rapa]
MFSSFGARMNDVRREKWVFRYKYECFGKIFFSSLSLQKPRFSFNPVKTGEEEEEVTLPHFVTLLYGMYDQGVLANGEEIAVKKLSEISKQGLDEFRTEAWNKYNERNWSEIIDEKIRQDCVQSWQVLRCIEVGLLWCLIILQGTYQKSPWSWLYSKRKQMRFKSQNALAFYPIDEGKSGIPSSSNSQGESSTSTSCNVAAYTVPETDPR